MNDMERFTFWVWHETNCIESPVLNRFFKYVYVGEDMKGRIEIAKRKLGI